MYLGTKVIVKTGIKEEIQPKIPAVNKHLHALSCLLQNIRKYKKRNRRLLWRNHDITQHITVSYTHLDVYKRQALHRLTDGVTHQ